MDKSEDEFGLVRSQSFPVSLVDSNVAERSSAVVLNIDIPRRQEGDEDRDRTGVDKLLPVVI